MMLREFFGDGSVEILDAILSHERARKILLVCGKDSFSRSGAEERVLPLLAGREIVRFSEFSHNPKLEDIQRGVELARSADVEMVLAVGGGSAIDIAKLVNVLAAQEAECAELIRGEVPIRALARPLVAVPTTAGTGSEVTHFAVAYIGHSKYSLAHPAILPTYAVIDPQLTAQMPPHLTAVTGLDALCQAIESFWAVGATETSRGYAEEAIRLLISNLELAVSRPTPEVRKNMALGALLAGKAINISKTTAPHALSYSITSHYGVPHGHAVALMIGQCFIANSMARSEHILHPLGDQFHSEVLGRLYSLLGVDSPHAFDRQIRGLLQTMGLEASLSQLGVAGDDLEMIASNVNIERLSNHPVRFSPDALLKMVSAC